MWKVWEKTINPLRQECCRSSFQIFGITLTQAAIKQHEAAAKRAGRFVEARLGKPSPGDQSIQCLTSIATTHSDLSTTIFI
jgi:hypothetical protein